MAAIPVGILTVSDACSRGQADDKSGPALRQLLAGAGGRWAVVATRVVGDSQAAIAQAVGAWTQQAECRLVVVCGGTGVAAGDVTVAALEGLFAKRLPALATAMVVGSLRITPMAALSQVAAGVINQSIVVAVPGSPKGATENLQQILAVLPHAVDCAATGRSGTRHLHGEASSGIEIGSGDVGSGVVGSGVVLCGCNRPDDADADAPAPLSDPLGTAAARRARASPYPMVAADAALQLVLDHAAPLAPVTVALADLHAGLVVAKDVVAAEDVPAYPAAVMDGYAVLAGSGGADATYRVVGAAAGDQGLADSQGQSVCVGAGQAVRVATGAAVPRGADAVVMVEDTRVAEEGADGEELAIRVAGAPVAGQHIRTVGHDLQRGAVVLRAGAIVTAAGGEAGAVAAAGAGAAGVCVHAMPCVGVLSTGDEVHDYGGPLPRGAVRDANRPALLAALAAMRCAAVDLGVARDDPDALTQALAQALRSCHVVITTGGASMGDRDWLKPVIEQRLRGRVVFGRVAMKPAKPTTFAVVPADLAADLAAADSAPARNCLLFALPGNPVSALVAFHVLVAPAIRKLAGHNVPRALRPSVAAVFIGPEWPLDAARPEFVRAALAWDHGLARWTARIADRHQQSSRIASMVGANALLALPRASAAAPTIRDGDQVTAIIISPPTI
ncbi:hypothetical protein GGI04_002295 [Coemansia thaxteri]|nr:hypothetical protein GGI04_002295 [Coemansia thaxteri]KAJ2480918.1 hypothetical protein EV174_003602 [Coemansia sp. RSA 2320]